MRIPLPFMFALLLAFALPAHTRAQAADLPPGTEKLETAHFILLSDQRIDPQLGRFVEQVWREVAKNIEDLDTAFKEVSGGNKMALFLYQTPNGFANRIQQLGEQAGIPRPQLENLKTHVGTPVPGGLAFNMSGRTTEQIQGPIAHLLAGQLLRLRLHHLGAKNVPEWLPIAFCYTIEFELMKRPSIRYVGYAEDSMGDQELRQTEVFTDDNWASTLRERVRKGTTISIYSVGVLTTPDLTAESVAFLYSLGRFLTSTATTRRQFNAFLRLLGEKPDERSAVLLLEAFEMDNTEFERRWMAFIRSRNFR